jgi:hypothetical protein
MTGDRVVHVESLSSQEVVDFVEVARSVCKAIDGIDHVSEIAFLRQMDRLLPLAHSRGQELDWPWHYEEDGGDEKSILDPEPEIQLPHGGHLEWWLHLRNAIGQKLSWHRVLSFVYDPVNPKEREAITADLADILADIYIALKIGLMHYDEGTIDHQSEAVWKWKFGASEGVGWAQQVAEAVLPVHHLIRTHYDEDDEAFDI